MIRSQDLKKYNLPNKPGVYFFKQNKVKSISGEIDHPNFFKKKNFRDILYIGKATSLKDRVQSYFSPDLINTRGPLIADLILKADKIDFIETDSVLEALILEASLIKKYQPKYNTKEKDNKSFNYVIFTKEDYPRVLIVRGRNLDEEKNYRAIFGPFPNSKQLLVALKIIRNIFPFRDKCNLNQIKPCFNYQIGLCPGTCLGVIEKKDYQKTIKNLELFFSGHKTKLISNLNKEMNSLAKEYRFELANKIKKTIFALNHIQDVALIQSDKKSSTEDTKENIFRIEAYDASHLSGTNNVGAMVVMENRELKRDSYRKFIINNSQGNDAGALAEILERRLKHSEWKMPNLIVVDGGVIQLNIAKKELSKFAKKIAVVAVVKNDKHKPKAIIGEEKIIELYKKEILLINNEAHRFVIAFQRQKRSAIIKK